jgi:hypothetical protein
MSVVEKQARLLKLGRAMEAMRGAKEAAKTKVVVAKGKEKEGSRVKEKTKAGKQKRGGGGDEEGEKARKKAKHNAGEASGVKRCAPREGEGREKRKKLRVEVPLPGPVNPRPKLTPAWKGAAGSSSRLDATSPSADSGAGSSASKKNTVHGVKRKGPPGWRPAIEQFFFHRFCFDYFLGIFSAFFCRVSFLGNHASSPDGGRRHNQSYIRCTAKKSYKSIRTICCSISAAYSAV